MRYMFEKRAGMDRVARVDPGNPGAATGATPASGSSTSKSKKDAVDGTTSATSTQLSQVGPLFTEAPVADSYDDDSKPDAELNQILDPKSPEAQAQALVADEALQEETQKRQNAERLRQQGVTFHDDRAQDWSPNFADAKDPLKGTPVASILDMDKKTGKLVFKKDGQTKERTFKGANGKDVKVKGLQDADVWGLLETLPGYEDMTDDMKKLLYEDVVAQGKEGSEQDQLLARLNYAVGKQARVSGAAQAMSSTQDREQLRQLARMGQNIFGESKKHFDPTNPDNKRDFLFWRLEQEGAGSEVLDEIRQTLKTREREEGDTPNYDRLLKLKNPQDILDELKPGSKKPKSDDEVKADEQKRVMPEAAQALDAAEKAQDDRVTEVDEILKSEKGQEQVAAREDEITASAESKKLEAQEVILERGLDGKDAEKFLGVSIEPFDADSKLTELKSKITDFEDKTEPFKAYWTAFEKAVKTGQSSEVVEAAWDNLGLTDDALKTSYRSTIADPLTQYQEEEELRAEKKNAAQVLRDSGLDDTTLEAFEKGTLTQDQIRDFQKSTKAKKEELATRIETARKHADELDRETGLSRAVQEAKEARQDYTDLLEAHSKGDFNRANRLQRKLTGEKRDAYGFDKLNGKEAVTHYKEMQADVQAAKKAAKEASLDDVKTAVDTPIGYVEKATGLLKTAQGFIGDINSIGEALGLRLDKSARAALLTAIESIFKDGGFGERGFKRDTIIGSGPEGSNFAKYESKRPEDSAAKNLAEMATIEKSGRARRQDIENKDALNTKSNAESVKLASEGMATEEKESASAGKKRRYKVHTNYGGPGIPV